MNFDGRPESRSAPQQQLLMVAAAAVVSALLANDWIAGLAVWVLWAVWHYLPTNEGPPVLQLALTFQWAQIVIGVFYYAISGRQLPPMQLAEDTYRSMMLIGLGCVLALLVGLKSGVRLSQRPQEQEHENENLLPLFTSRVLLMSYLAAIVFTGFIQKVAWGVPQLTQGILALGFIHYALLYLVLRHLTRQEIHWKSVIILLMGETILGLTGFFAGFREPLMIAALAFLQIFDRRKIMHWVGISALAIVMFSIAVLWMGVRTPYRQDFKNESFTESRLSRLETITSLSFDWSKRDFDQLMTDVDALVDRLWAVYYPALTLGNVPRYFPHEQGSILWTSVRHLLTPRLLFPEKDTLPSDSEMVRKYSGVWVASSDQDTSVAFGYAAESYVDFGLPWMFVPVLFYGLLMGIAYQSLFQVIRNRELAIALVTTVFWCALYLFERSWIKTLGFSVTLIVYLGGVGFLLDFLLSRNRVVTANRRPEITTSSI